MKKFALGILSVFIILGGVLLSACEKKVSLSVSTEEIVIYTNDEQAENYQSKVIDVSVGNSSSGINVEILSGGDSVRVSPVTVKNSSNYAFTIYGDKSGEAEVKVSAKADTKQSKIINVHVKTILEDIETAADDNVDGRTNLYVTKTVGKKLNVDDYFDLKPVTANVKDIVWTFEDSDEENSQQYVKDGVVYATIINDVLLVNNDYNLPQINLRASFVNNTSIFANVSLEVLENSTINNLTIDGKPLYQNDSVAATSIDFDMVRNNANESKLEGSIIINSPYEITLEPVVYEKLDDGTMLLLTSAEYQNYLTLEIDAPIIDDVTNQIRYNFSIDALDKFAINKFGTFYFYFKIGYKDYNFDILSDGSVAVLKTFYTATRIEVSNSNGDILNGNSIDVFSNYTSGNGYKISTNVLPSEVAIDNSMFYISVDLNQDALKQLILDADNPVSSFAKIYYRGQELRFTNEPGSSVYNSSLILNGSDIYISSAETFDIVEGVEFTFSSASDKAVNVNTSLNVNFYKISTDETLTLTTEEDDDLPATTYMSSSISAVKSQTFTVKIKDMSTISGLSLKYDENARFNFSGIQLISSSADTEEGVYVVVRFTVLLNGYNFDSTVNFWFEHVTGKTSSKYAIQAFVPLTSASISNADKSSSDVYKDDESLQTYVDLAGIIDNDETKQSSSLSRLMLEAGTSISLNTNYQNASLSEAGISYKVLTFENLVAAVKAAEGLQEDDAAYARAEEIFALNSLDTIALDYNYYRFFIENDGLYFTINENRLSLTDNEFKGYVCVLFNGYDEEHNDIVIARFFALESFYSVRYLSSSVKTTLLYTAETLSQNDIGLSRVDVSVAMRPDDKIPTYTDKLSYFSFTSALENFEASQDGTYLRNKYYEITNIAYSTSGKALNFRITANSTNLQTSVRDILTITYRDDNGFTRKTEIQIEIKNVKRVESVQWLNRTEDGEIYLNLTTTVSSERSFTISASVSPSDSYDINLAHAYFATAGSSSDLAITTSSIGQSFNLNINTSKGGYGNLYLLPNDMIKTVDGVNQVLVYHYTEEANGEIVETPVYVRLSELDAYYEEIINGNDEISNYFYNNDHEKIYYKDLIVKIAITIADGMSEGTAIRVYNEADLKSIDTAKYYRIMNNITLTNWVSYNEFSGMFFGKDETITLTFEGNSQSFVNTLLEKGTIKNLTFVGNVLSAGTESAGFVANTNRGTIDGVKIDVYYSDGLYKSSTLNATASYVGGIAGINFGTIKNTYSYGVSINAVNGLYVGGIAGDNQKTIENCGVEFYNFVSDDDVSAVSSNKITANCAVGGIVGFARGTSVISKSYAYAYSLMNAENSYIGNVFANSSSAKGLFMASFEAGARINESFAFMGSLKTPFESNTSAQFINVTNSYITYYDSVSESAEIETRVFENAIFAYTHNSYYSQLGYEGQVSDDNVLNSDDIPADYTNPGEEYSKWNNLKARLDADIWEMLNIDSEVNFGFMHLKGIKQSAAIDVAEVNIADNVSPLKSLNAGNNKGILFVYSPLSTISDTAEQSALTSYNTISVADLFGVSEEQARSLLLTSESKNISISTNSIRILSKNVTEFEVDVHSKMNFTSYKTFKFIVLNFLPELVTTIDSVELKDDQTVLLQTGLNNSRTVMFNMNNTIYLNGTGYSTVRDSFSVEYDVSGNSYEETAGEQKEYVTLSKSNNSLKLIGNKNHSNDDVSSVDAYIVVDDIAKNQDYSNAIRNQRTRSFDISVYNGATSLVIDNASSLIVKPSQYAVFDVTMETDAENDNIVVGMNYGEIELPNELSSDENSARFVVDSKLVLNVSWTKTATETGFKFRVWVRVDDQCKHLIDQNYTDLSISVDAVSQHREQNSQYAKTIGLSVLTQEIEDFSISTYNVESRQIKNSVLYLKPADEITNTLTPASDAIIAVTVDPAYALMTRFTLTYASNTTGNVGTVSISKLAFDSRYGYYVNSNSTSLIENGIEVSLTDADKMGNGVFYFRIYISSSFATSTALKFTLSYYNGSTLLVSGTHNINIDYLQSANIKVNGASTYVLAKGSSATVTVTVDANQELDNLYLQNNGSNISLSAYTVEDFGSYKVYSATISAYVDAKLTGNKDSGIFYVCATVRRMVNNTPEIKESRATICLVDFSVDGNNIKLSSSGGTSNYNGRTYDVFYSYINATDTLSFDYPFMPESYDYDVNNASEVSAVEKIMEERARFERGNTYADDEVGYYINYNFNELTGAYEEIDLKYQLSYATDESHSSSIYNNSGFVSNGVFAFDEVEGRYNDGTPYSYLTVKGIKTGRQLMKLTTTIIYQGVELYYDYYFLIVVDVWSDEDTPTQIFDADEFIDYATNSEQPDDYILMNDIVLTNYTPINTDLIDSLDGNGYTIHINSFAFPEESGTLNLALFNTVTENTTLKNVRVNIYNGGQITVNVAQYTNINIAGFAIENNGVIYNCEVLSYYDENYQSSALSGEAGLVVKYTMGQNTDPIEITYSMASSLGIESKVSGFVVTNNASIMNSRVGGESFRKIITVAGTNYIKTQSLDLFVLRGQCEVSGFVNTNGGSGYISASFADNIQIYNDMADTTSLTAGFAVYNNNNIQNSYVEGKGSSTVSSTGETNIYNNLSNITSIGVIGGFVYENNALIKNSYSNIAIENSESKASLVAGFVYINNESAEVSLCYSACDITKTDINQMQFSGVNDFAESLNYGTISFSYFYNESLIDDTNQSSLTSGALSVSDVMNEDTFYGFSFASEPGAYNGIWSVSKTNKLTLVSANQIAFSNRYAVTNGSVTSIFYNRSIVDADTMRSVDLSYGSENNPIIIRNAYEFAVATGKATNTEISSYKEYYSDTEVFGNYRIVNNIDMSEIDQNSEGDNSVKLQTTKKTFTGLLDGNGFTISNISLGSSELTENYGLFAKLDGAVIMNLDLIVESIHNSRANIVGTLAGTAVDSRILAVSLAPSTVQGGDKTSILGNNVVGGVVGMLFGESKLSDISVVDIDVYSAYYLSGKKVGDNNNYVGTNLRGYASNGNSISTYASRISYAGAVAGYVDIYDSLNSETVSFSSSLEVSDYDIITVHVSDSVNIYGEVAGGLFGYVGNSTLIYDATIDLDADMSLDKPSYIISKNLYAGGLIGENYGGLFAVSASYAEDLQKNRIEANENSYYSGNITAEKGQQSIFSYTPSDEGYDSNINDPLYVGGLVGYMGGGYIYIGYNKLNVISHSDETLAVGGVVGLAGYTDNQYDLAYLSSTPKINILLNDVYASGDVYIDSTAGKGYSSGIIGALERNSLGQISVVAMKNVVAVNYYSYDGSKLVGDISASTEAAGGYVSDRHFMLVGKIFNSRDNSEYSTLDSSLYIIDSGNNVFDLSKTYTFTGNHQSNTVGGYTDVLFGSSSVVFNLKPYGFGTSWDSNDATKYNESILKVESIGSSNMANASASYAKMYSYFIANGWDDYYWEHTENELFPHIELLPTLNIIFWDVYNTKDVLDAMRNGNVTVVLRGKVDQEGSAYQDIDLRSVSIQDHDKYGNSAGNAVEFEPISNFHGELISYYEYSNSNTEGFVTNPIFNGETVVGGNSESGNKMADTVGIIIDQPLFAGLTDGASVEGINIYMCAKTNETDIDYTLVNESTGNAILRDVKIVLNNNVNINTDVDIVNNRNIYSAGLITRISNETSYYNIDINIRNNASVNFVHSFNTAEQDIDVYMGLLAGYIEQTSAFTQINIQGINIYNEKSTDDNIFKSDVNFRIDNVSYSKLDLYAGLYAGKITKSSGRAKISLELSNVGNVNSNFTVASSDETNVYIGGYAGEIESVDNIYLSEEETDDTSEFDINQLSNVNMLNAGLAFGSIVNSYLNITNLGGNVTTLKGGIYQIGENVRSNQVNIGGFAGTVNSTTQIQSYSVEFNVGRKDSISDEANDYIVDEETKETLFDQNLYNYDSGLSSYVVNGDQNYIGGFFGSVIGTIITITGSCNLAGNIDIEVSNESSTTTPTNKQVKVYVGGVIGWLQGSVLIDSTIYNDFNIAVREDLSKACTTAYVGGLVGAFANVSADDGSGNSTSSSINNMLHYFYYNGNVLASVDSLIFGGAVGYIQRTDFVDQTKAIAISRVVYGGAVKIYGQEVDSAYYLPKNVTVGGVVGEFAYASLTTEAQRVYTISNCYTYGDVFVNYLQNATSKDKSDVYNSYIETYNFGGIVGIGSYISVKNCSTIMTSFNERISRNELSIDGGDYSNTNAIVGRNSSVVEYENNKYNSSVCMAYQEETGNFDVMYGDAESYSGYSSIYDGASTGDGTTSALTTSTNILTDYENIGIRFSEFEEGHKLSPYAWGQSNGADREIFIREKESDVVEDYEVEITGKFHNITWVAVTEDITTSRPMAENLKNCVIIGNGHLITRNDDSTYTSSNTSTSTAKGFGGLINNMGESFDKTVLEPNFNVVAGMLVNLQIPTVDVNGESSTGDGNSAVMTIYGGLVGTMKGSSFIYGVGIKGELSVGGKNAQLYLGGFVGLMERGVISESYVDADITYRASEQGVMSGIANMAQGNTTVKSTYSSGRLETYIDIRIYTFANSANNDGIRSSDILDSYSISQVKRNSVSGEDITSSIEFVNLFGIVEGEENKAGVNVVGNVISGSNEVLTNPYGTSYDIDDLSVPYYGLDGKNGTVKNSLVLSDNQSVVTEHNWYFNRYVNYGYASHGFGYLKNVTTYTYESVATAVENSESLEETFVDSYVPITYQDAINLGNTYGGGNGWYLGVLNQAKFDQMYDTVKATVDGQVNTNYTFNYKFVLRYDFAVSNNNVGTDLGIEGKDLIIDGQNNTIDLSNALNSGLFGTFRGIIKNLRIDNMNINVTNSATGNTFGGLANTLYGDLDNVSVNGEITNISNTNVLSIGGVVGTLFGDATNIDSVVVMNIEGNVIVGGVVGILSENSTLSYATNNGTIVQTSLASSYVKDPETNQNISVEAYSYIQSTTSTITRNLNGIVGGLVGYAESTSKILNSYNTNAVLSGFSQTRNVITVAGGIVGYAEASTIENAYNTGFVGSGNTNSATSFAGGIIGYGKNTIVTSCINDGAVQAVTSASGRTKYDVSEICVSGNETTSSFSTVPNDLVYEITMTYNKGGNRNVFAFGIGYLYGSASKIENSSSSTNNIKNDGDLGEIVQTKDLVFNRLQILDGNGTKTASGDNSGGDYEGKYSAEGKIYINGFDSYGYATRIYMKDSITRRYVGGAYGNYVNEIQYNTRYAINDNLDKDWNAMIWHSFYGAKYTLNDDGTTNLESYSSTDNYNSILSNFSDDDYYLTATSTYYQSLNFVGYDEFLTVENEDYVNGLVGSCDGTIVRNEFAFSNTNNQEKIDSAINSLNAEKQSNEIMKNITIDGENASIIYNGSNLKTVYAPAKTEFSLNLPLDNIDFASISTKDFMILNIVDETGKEVEPQFYSVNFERSSDGNSMNVNFVVYFANSVSGRIYYTISYRTLGNESIVLGKNNVTVENGKVTISLIDDNNTVILSEETVEGINEDVDNRNYKVSAVINGIDISDRISFVYDENATSIVYNGYLNSSFIDNGVPIEIDIQKMEYYQSTVSGSISVQNNLISPFNVGETSETSLAVFYGYNYSNDTGISTYEDITTTVGEQSYVTGIKIPLQQVLDLYNTRLAFGKENVYSVQYENSVFSVSDESSDGYKFEISNENGQYYLCIYKAEIDSDNQETIIDENTENIADYKDDLNSFFENNILTSSIYYDKTGTISTYSLDIKNGKQENNSFVFEYTSEPVDNGNFGADAIYKGDINDFNAEPNAVGTEFFGLMFYQNTVTYSYRVQSGTLINKTGKNVGYEMILTKDSSVVAKTQGYLTSDNTQTSRVELDNNIIKNIDQFTVTTYSTSNYYNTQNTVVGYSITNGQLDGSIVYGENSYVIANGTETCPICGETKNYIATIGSFYNRDTIYSYTYKIYECGEISVEYTYRDGESGATGSNKYERDRKYVTNIDLILEGKMYQYRSKIASQTDYEGQVVYTYEWEEIPEGDGNYIPFNLSVFDYKPSDGGYDQINVDLIATYLSEELLLFARTPLQSGEQLSTIKYKTESKQQIDILKDQSIELYSTNVESFTFDGEFNEGTFEYKVGENGTWTSLENSTINAETYRNQTYYYRYNTTITNATRYIEISIDDEDANNFTYIIFDEDIYFDITIKDNNKVIIGNNHNLLFVNDGGNGISLFTSNSKMIKDLNIIGVDSAYTFVSGANTEELAMFVVDNSADIINVNVYGNIRNIDSQIGQKGVRSTIFNNTSAVSKLKISSYVVITGLDSESGKDVKTVLLENIAVPNGLVTSDTYYSENILIAGNGGNGEDGDDGNIRTTFSGSFTILGNLNGKNGKNGENGGDGGDITIDSSTFNGIYKLGIKGIAGNGGNGANGAFLGTNYGSIGGGSGGRKGITASDGTVSQTSQSSNNYVSVSQNTKTDLALGGNGGIGGFGRIQNNIFYYSGGSGGSNGSGAGYNGGARVWKTEISSENLNTRIGYGYMSNQTILTSDDTKYNVGWSANWWLGWEFSDKRTADQKTEFDNMMNSLNTDGINLAGVTAYGSDAEEVKVSKIYFTVQLVAEIHIINGWDDNVMDYRKVGWTSGEGFNSVGNCGYTSYIN